MPGTVSKRWCAGSFKPIAREPDSCPASHEGPSAFPLWWQAILSRGKACRRRLLNSNAQSQVLVNTRKKSSSWPTGIFNGLKCFEALRLAKNGLKPRGESGTGGGANHGVRHHHPASQSPPKKSLPKKNGRGLTTRPTTTPAKCGIWSSHFPWEAITKPPRTTHPRRFEI